MAGDTAPVWFTELVDKVIRDVGSQTELARQLGVSQQTVSNWKLGGSPMPDQAARFAEVAGVDAIELACRLWPDLGHRDRLARLRVVLSDATTSELDALVDVAEQMVAARHVGSSKRRGRR